MTDSTDERVAEIIERGIHSHVVWRDYLEANPDFPTKAAGLNVGDLASQKKWIEDYEFFRKAYAALQTERNEARAQVEELDADAGVLLKAAQEREAS